MRIVAFLCIVTATLTSVPPAGAAPDAAGDERGRGAGAVLAWNDVALEAVRQSRSAPPMVARALAIVHTCMYDAWAAYDRTAVATELGDSLRRPPQERTERSKQEAVSFAAYRALVDLFPAQRSLFDARMQQLGYNPLDTTTDVTVPAGIGNVSCAALLEFRHGDGSNQLGDINGGAPYSDYTHYVPVNTPTEIIDPDHWQPLTFSNGLTPGFLAPHWGLVAPFALPDGSIMRPPPPAVSSEDRYRRQAEAILRISAGLTDRQKAISEYWSDGPGSETPPGHWNLLAQIVARREGYTLDEDVQLFFALNNALLDASIAVWDCKRFYDSVRPITAIRFLFASQQVEAWGGPFAGTRTIDGADWLPYQPGTFLTPPFPEYVSGHSTFSAAAAEILKLFTGSDRFGHEVRIEAGSSFIEPGLTPRKAVTLHWRTLSDAADQAGWSRRFGGIHFRDGDRQGRAMGRQVGRLVWARSQLLWGGPRADGRRPRPPSTHDG
jgi:hypothetical protein